MIIRRIRHDDGFTIVPNQIANDRRLSLEAVGLMTYLLGRPNNWNANVNQLRGRGKCGRDRMRGILNECIDAGYIDRRQERNDDDGRMGRVVYVVYDQPRSKKDDQGLENGALDDCENDDFSGEDEGQNLGNPGPENPSAVPPQTDLPATDLPAPDFQGPESIKKENNTLQKPKLSQTQARDAEREGFEEGKPEGQSPSPETGQGGEDRFEDTAADGEGRVVRNPDTGTDATAEDRPGTAAFSKRVQRLCAGAGYVAGSWPYWDKIAFGWIARQFAALSPAERAEAERWRDPYLIDCHDRKSKPMGLGVFLRDRAWNALEPAILDRFEKMRSAQLAPEDRAQPDGWAKFLGPVGMAKLFAELLAGPPAGPAEPNTLWFEINLRQHWPAVHQWKAQQQQKGGDIFGERWHALKADLEAVPAGTDMHAAWKARFAQNGWPWLAVFDAHPVLYAPKGGPDGLADFEKALVAGRGHDGNDRPQAAE